MEVTAVSDLYSIGVILYEALTGRVPFEGDSAVAIAMKQVSQAPQRPSSINPEVSPGARRGRDAGAGEGPRAALPERRRLHRRARRGARRTRRAPGGGTAAFAPLPPPSSRPRRRPRRSTAAKRRERRRRRWPGSRRRRDPDRRPGRPGADPRHDDRGARRDRQPARAWRSPCSKQNGFKVGEVSRVERDAAGNTVLEQDPTARRRDEASLDCALPQLLLLEAGGGADRQRRPGQRRGARRPPGLPGKRRSAKLEDAGFEVAGRDASTPTGSTAGLVIHSDPSGGSTATRGSTVILTVSSGPKLAKVPVLVGTQRAVAVQQIRGRGLVPSVSEEESSTPGGRGDPPGAERRHGARAAARRSRSSSPRASSRSTVPNVIGKLRAEAVAALREAGLDPTVQEQETEVPAQVGRSPTSSRRRAPKSNRAPR